VNNNQVDNSSLASYGCRFHPTDWWHEVGCSHQSWSFDELLQAKRMASSFSPMKAADLDRQLQDKLNDLKPSDSKPIDGHDKSPKSQLRRTDK
jgi:hypothetical protein